LPQIVLVRLGDAELVRAISQRAQEHFAGVADDRGGERVVPP